MRGYLENVEINIGTTDRGTKGSGTCERPYLYRLLFYARGDPRMKTALRQRLSVVRT